MVDVGSLNGTYVNREPVDTAVLANGDEVQIGKFRLVFLTGPREPGAIGCGRRKRRLDARPEAGAGRASRVASRVQDGQEEESA